MAGESTRGSVTRMIAALKTDESDAASELWNRYFQRLTAVARRRLGAASRRVADEEDVALNVLNSLCAGAARGRFPQLTDRNDLWKLLLAITRQKTVDQIRRVNRIKRGGGNVRGDSMFAGKASDSALAGFDGLLAEEPTPEFLAQLRDQHLHLLELLEDETLRRVALWKMESYTNEEIAVKLQLAVSTVERKLKRIRELWLEPLEGDLT